MQKSCSWNRRICICENSSCLKSIDDDLVVVCDEVINVVDSVSANVTNTISANVTSTVLINSDDKKLTCEKKLIALFTLLF